MEVIFVVSLIFLCYFSSQAPTATVVKPDSTKHDEASDHVQPVIPTITTTSANGVEARPTVAAQPSADVQEDEVRTPEHTPRSPSLFFTL